MRALLQKMIYLLLSLNNDAFAQMASNYDPLCKRMAQTWKLPNTSSPTSVVIANLSAMRSKSDVVVKNQLQIWKEVDQISNCLSSHAGLMFLHRKVIDPKTRKEVTKDYLIVTDPKKVETFRLAKNNLQCQINDAPFIYEDPHRYQDNTRVINHANTMADRDRYEQAYDRYKKDELEKNAKIRKDILVNNSLGDVGLDNYCAHQLQMWQLSKKSHDLRNKRRVCENAKDEGTLNSQSGCGDFPEKLAQDMKALAKEMEKIFADTDYQPYDLMNDIDREIYSQFIGDVDKLKEAQRLAEKSLKWSYDAEKFLKQNNIWSDQSLGGCGENDPTNSNQFNLGLESCTGYEHVLNVETTNFSTNIEVVKNIHRDNLIKELNLKSFGQNVETSFHLLENGSLTEKALRKDLWVSWKNKNDSDEKYKSACEKMSASNLCMAPQYFKQFKDGLKRAMTGIQTLDDKKKKLGAEGIYPPGTFLRYDSNSVATNINKVFSNMREICNGLDPEVNNLLGFDPEAQKKLEISYREQLISLQHYAGYFYDGVIKGKTKIDKWLHGCPADYSGPAYPLTIEDVEKSKAGFLLANKNQMNLASDFARPDRGGHSNTIGEMACGKYGKEKEDLYALSALLTGHPYMAGQMIGSIDQRMINKEKKRTGIDKRSVDVEKRIYTQLLCEAKECSANVHDFNNAAADTIKNVAVAASFLPLPGIAFITTSVYLAADIGQIVVNHNEANEKKNLIQSGLLSGGFSPEYDSEIANKIKQFEEKGSINKLAEEIFISLAVQASATGSAQLAMSSLKHTKTEAIKRLTPLLKSIKPASELEGGLANTLIDLEKKAVGNEKVALQKMIKHINDKGTHHVVKNSFGYTFYDLIHEVLKK
jgi:hypothetical protein